MAKGRKRKKGDNRKRTESGQLSRAGLRAMPSQWVQDRQARFGNHYSSAIGRAYASGLLGEGNIAKTRLDAGNKFALRHSKIIGGDHYTCPLDNSVKGNNASDHERDMHQQQWLWDTMANLDHTGHRTGLDQLIGRQYTDNGPLWLDAILLGSKDPLSLARLAHAVKALDIVAGVDAPIEMTYSAVNA